MFDGSKVVNNGGIMEKFDNNNENEKKICQNCGGSGMVECPDCGGTGMVVDDTHNHKNQLKVCFTCLTKGYITCDKCNGSGFED